MRREERRNSPGTEDDDAFVRDDGDVLVHRGEHERTGVLRMGAIRYAVRVRGRPTDAVMAALPEELDVTVEPVRTVLRGRLPDQAALIGVLTRAWLLGLELIEVRRQPQPAPSLRGGEAPGRFAPPVGGL